MREEIVRYLSELEQAEQLIQGMARGRPMTDDSPAGQHLALIARLTPQLQTALKRSNEALAATVDSRAILFEQCRGCVAAVSRDVSGVIVNELSRVVSPHALAQKARALAERSEQLFSSRPVKRSRWCCIFPWSSSKRNNDSKGLNERSVLLPKS